MALMQEVAAHANIFMKVRPPTPLLPCCQLPTIGSPPSESPDHKPSAMPQVSGTMEAASQTDDDGARADGAVRVASSEPGFYRPMLELLWRCFGEARRLPQPLQCHLHARPSSAG